MIKRSFPEGWPSQRIANKPTMEPATDSEVIELAWCDETSFDCIKLQTGLAERDVIKLMRSKLKPSSYRLWRKRVSGRATKHAAKVGKLPRVGLSE